VTLFLKAASGSAPGKADQKPINICYDSSNVSSRTSGEPELPTFFVISAFLLLSSAAYCSAVASVTQYTTHSNEMTEEVKRMKKRTLTLGEAPFEAREIDLVYSWLY